MTREPPSSERVLARVIAIAAVAALLGAAIGIAIGSSSSRSRTTSVLVNQPTRTVTITSTRTITTKTRPAATATTQPSTAGTANPGNGCPAGEIISQSYGPTAGQCVRTGYSTQTNTILQGTTPAATQGKTFVDPNGNECASSLVQNGYCQAP
jgi:hypothetical protein